MTAVGKEFEQLQSYWKRGLVAFVSRESNGEIYEQKWIITNRLSSKAGFLSLSVCQHISGSIHNSTALLLKSEVAIVDLARQQPRCQRVCQAMQDRLKNIRSVVRSLSIYLHHEYSLVS